MGFHAGADHLRTAGTRRDSCTFAPWRPATPWSDRRRRGWGRASSRTSSAVTTSTTSCRAAVAGVRRRAARRRVDHHRGRRRGRAAGLGLRRGRDGRLRRPRRDRPARRRRAARRDRGGRGAVRAHGYRVARIEAPGTLDGGDVLKHGGTVWVGLGGRTNEEGVEQLRAHLAPLGAEVIGVPLARCCTSSPPSPRCRTGPWSGTGRSSTTRTCGPATSSTCRRSRARTSWCSTPARS